MALKALKKTAGEGGGDFELAPEGQQAACLVAIIDLGTQVRAFPGKPTREMAQVVFVWELLENKGAGELPFLLLTDYTPSLDERSHLAKLIKGWLGKTIKEGELYDYTAPARQGGLLGRYCYVTIAHEASKSGKKDAEGNPRRFARIVGVAGVPPAAQASLKGLKPQTVPFKWEIEEPVIPPIAEKLYLYGSKLSDCIAGAIERGGKRPTTSHLATAGKPQYDVAGTAGGAAPDLEDCPF